MKANEEANESGEIMLKEPKEEFEEVKISDGVAESENNVVET